MPSAPKNPFRLVSKFPPAGDQPQAIDALVGSVNAGNRFQTLQGITGSGKTFTMANVIARTGRPALVLAHNKTLAAQLAQEFKEFFPDNAVHYFVSYYDYYQPEAYIQRTDTYIEKESSINEEIDRLRHAATESLLTRPDVIIVASVSCIYGIGNKEDYFNLTMPLETGKQYKFEDLIDQLVTLQFTRSGVDFKQGMFQVIGDVVEIFPASSETVLTLEFFGDHLDRITRRNYFTGEIYEHLDKVVVFPAKHTVTTTDRIKAVVPQIRADLEKRLAELQAAGEIVKRERLKTKVEYDLEMMLETGYVRGIENYSMYLDGRTPGMPPMTLMDYFPPEALCFIDESHITVSQVGGMYGGDRSRKDALVENGFRLASAYENRPLKFDEFEKKLRQTVFVSATPSHYERDHSSAWVTQEIRPTGLLDPLIEVEDMAGVADSLLARIRAAVKKNERALVTTLTKRSAEELAEFLQSNGVKAVFLHSDIDTVERLTIIKDLRLGKTEVIVGVNLLREGLDLPEVSFIGVADADKQGFLRSETSLIQIIGRAARNANGVVVLYSHACKVSPAMQSAMDLTATRRAKQHAYNEAHGITPTTVISSIKDSSLKGKKKDYSLLEGESWEAKLKRLELEMDVAAANLDFEKAAELRDAVIELKREGKGRGR